jgi:NAD(P)-dependent dehydrogenase (short-subunit alcohol dehydrogenase family)
VTLLINNAGSAAFQGAISAPSMNDARREMEVNCFGPLALTRAWKPVLAEAGGGAIVNSCRWTSQPAGDGDLLGVQGSVPLRYAKHSRRAWGKTRWSR